MDYHSAINFIGCLHIHLLTINTAATAVLLFVAALLFVVSFLIAGSEVAFFSLTYKDINMLRTKKQPAFKRIVSLVEEPKMLLASMLITGSLVNIGIILISNILLEGWLEPLHQKEWVNVLIKIVSITFVIVLFGEILPKIWATNHKIWFAATASLVIEIFHEFFLRLGFSRRLSKLTDGIEKKLTPANAAYLDAGQLDYAIDLLPENEATVEEKQILKGIRKFSDTTVKQVMRTRLDVSGIKYNSSFDEVIKRVEDLHYSRLPVYRNNLDEIEGILQTKDLLPYLNNNNIEFDWHTLMRSAFFVHEQKLIEDLLQEFRNKRTHLAIVVDEFGGTSGIVTLEDIMEEIIGDIRDEFDDEEIVNKKIDDHTFVFEGRTMINDVCKVMGIPANTFKAVRGDSGSLAGLVLEIAGEFPKVNEEVVSGDFVFIPLEINKNRIDKVRVEIRMPK